MTTANVRLYCSADQPKVTTLATYRGGPSLSLETSYSSSQVTKCYQLETTQSTTQSYLLDDGSLTDVYGTSLVFSSIQLLAINNKDATQTLTVGGGTHPVLGSDQYTVKAGQLLIITSPFTVDATHDLLRIVPSGSMTFDLLVVGS